MRRFFKLVSLTMQGRMYYRAGFVLALLTPLVLLAGQFLLWQSLYAFRGGEAMGDFTQRDMFSYILVAFAINNLLTWSSENTLSREIRTGMVVARKLRPVSFLAQSLATMFGNLLLQGVVNFGAIILAFVIFARHLTLPTVGGVLLFLPSLAMAVLVRMMMSHCFGLLCFFTTSSLGLNWIRGALMDFFSGALIPVALFPAWLRTLSYALPFPLMLQVPAAILLSQPLPMPLWRTFALQFFWVAIFFGLHALLYSRVRRQATIAGG